MDSYTYEDLYGVTRYNFPMLYRYWDYRNQDYYDPDGNMSREEVIDYIFENGEPEVFLLSVKAYSSRYMASDKYGTGDYNMENAWYNSGVMDTQRTMIITISVSPAARRERRSTTTAIMNLRATRRPAPMTERR